jgi:hypothetical protein
MEAVTQKNAALVEESTASLTAVDAQVDGVARVISFFEAGAAALGRTARPQGARALQSALPDRLSGNAGPDQDRPDEPQDAQMDGKKDALPAATARRAAGTTRKQVNWDEF